jgi:hypothetical protein
MGLAAVAAVTTMRPGIPHLSAVATGAPWPDEAWPVLPQLALGLGGPPVANATQVRVA